MLRAIFLHVVAAAALGTVALAQEKKPPVPPGRDPGGVVVALISTGMDYTLPTLAHRLARDGEGELIGWDLEDNDRRPFDKSKGGTPPELGGDGTAIASLLSSGEDVRLVPVRVNPADPASPARALAFAAQTPARVALISMSSTRPEIREPLHQAATRFKDILIILPASGTDATSPAVLGLDNVLAVEPGSESADAVGFGGRMQRLSGPPLAVAAAGKAAAALLAREPRLDVGVLKRRLVEASGGGLWRARK
jgi:hypothetical protein